MERFCQFAVTASKEALTDSGLNLSLEDPYEMGVLIGSGIGSLHIVEETHLIYMTKGPEKFSPFMIPLLIINMAAGWVSIFHGLKGPNMAVVSACATGNHAIGEAFRIIQHGQAKVMVAEALKAVLHLSVLADFVP